MGKNQEQKNYYAAEECAGRSSFPEYHHFLPSSPTGKYSAILEFGQPKQLGVGARRDSSSPLGVGTDQQGLMITCNFKPNSKYVMQVWEKDVRWHIPHYLAISHFHVAPFPSTCCSNFKFSRLGEEGVNSILYVGWT